MGDHVFAGGRYEVALFDAVPGVAETAREASSPDAWRELAGHEPRRRSGRRRRARVRAARDLADGLAGAGHVQENTPETVETKRAIFTELDRLAAPDAILASSTSTIVASRFTEPLEGRPPLPRRRISVNPPHLVPVVELAGAPWTTAETDRDRQGRPTRRSGKVPIVVKKEIGRLHPQPPAGGAAVRRRSRLVEDGYVTPQDLDKTIKDGLGLRWSFMGPFETIELNAPGGTPDYCARYGPSLARLSGADPAIYQGEPLARLLALWGDARRARQRSPLACAGGVIGRLAALKAHKRGQPAE